MLEGRATWRGVLMGNFQMRNSIRISLAFLLFFSIHAVLWGGIQVEAKLTFSKDSPKPNLVWDFCMADDDLFLIPDHTDGDIKIYQNNGGSLVFLKTIGSKGYGTGQFAKPAFIWYNKKTFTLAVMDIGMRKIFIYDRVDRMEFRRIKSIPSLRGGQEIKVADNEKLFVSGGATNRENKRFAFYSIDLMSTTGNINYLLPYHSKFGIESPDALEKKIKERGLGAIGMSGVFDVHDDVAYFAWEGNLKVMKINVKSGLIYPETFGDNTDNYVKPTLTDGLNKGYFQRDFQRVRSEKKKMSLVRKIFVTKARVFVIYEGPVKPESRFWVQTYTLDGTPLNEDYLEDLPSRMMYFDKAKNTLYSLSNEGADGNHFILKYRIPE